MYKFICLLKIQGFPPNPCVYDRFLICIRRDRSNRSLPTLNTLYIYIFFNLLRAIVTWNRPGQIVNIKHTCEEYISSADSFVPDPPITANRPRRQSPKRNFFSSICSARRNSNVSGISPSYARRFPSINQAVCAYSPRVLVVRGSISIHVHPWSTRSVCVLFFRVDARFSGNFPRTSLARFSFDFFPCSFCPDFVSFYVLSVTRSNVIKLQMQERECFSFDSIVDGLFLIRFTRWNFHVFLLYIALFVCETITCWVILMINESFVPIVSLDFMFSRLIENFAF